jgi:hypothetical protein
VDPTSCRYGFDKNACQCNPPPGTIP